jgi:plastocyanin
LWAPGPDFPARVEVRLLDSGAGQIDGEGGRRVKVWKLGAVGVLTAFALAACGSSPGTGSSTGGCTPKGGASGATAAQTVKINSDPNTIGRYDPQTVNAKVGDTVEWDWVDSSAPHTVTAQDGSFDSCTQNAGFKFMVTFTKAGDVQYRCTIHSGMTGDIKVG